MIPPDESQWGQWPTLIGEFFIAFGALERATLDYLKLMERDEETLTDMLGRSFRARVEWIQQSIAENTSLDQTQKSALQIAWMRTFMLDARRLALALRPSILHPNPVGTDNDTEELLWNPHLIELHVDFEEPQLISMAELKASIGHVRETASELMKLLPLLG